MKSFIISILILFSVILGFTVFTHLDTKADRAGIPVTIHVYGCDCCSNTELFVEVYVSGTLTLVSSGYCDSNGDFPVDAPSYIDIKASCLGGCYGEINNHHCTYNETINLNAPCTDKLNKH